MKIIALAAAALATLVAGCSCTPQQQYPNQYPQGDYVQQQPYQPAPVVVQRDSHGDAILGAALGAGAGYMAGKAANRRDRDYGYNRRYYSAPRRYVAPSRRVFSVSPSRSRASTFGGYRSRRR